VPLFFFELYAFIILTSTLVLGINYFVIITRPLHPVPVRKRSSSSCYMIEGVLLCNEKEYSMPYEQVSCIATDDSNSYFCVCNRRCDIRTYILYIRLPAIAIRN